MHVNVMQIWQMGVPMLLQRVYMNVAVLPVNGQFVRMFMMSVVMVMAVFVFYFFMAVYVLVLFKRCQICPYHHYQKSNNNTATAFTFATGKASPVIYCPG
jgi:ABC-type multidrug transport system fused ATPase/permease subunit